MKKINKFLVALVTSLTLSSCSIFSSFINGEDHLDPDHVPGPGVKEGYLSLDRTSISLHPMETVELNLSVSEGFNLANLNLRVNEDGALNALTYSFTNQNSKFTVSAKEQGTPIGEMTTLIIYDPSNERLTPATLEVRYVASDARATAVVLSEYSKDLYPGEAFSFHVSLDVTENDVYYSSTCLSEEIEYDFINATTSEADISGYVKADATVNSTISIGITADVSGIENITPATYTINVLSGEPAKPENPANTDSSKNSGYGPMYGSGNESVNVSSVGELCDAIALAMVKRLQYVEITTKFNNTITESELYNYDYSVFNSFGGIADITNYSTGSNKTFRLYFAYSYSDADVSLIASHKSTQTPENTYEEFKNANFENRLAKTTRRSVSFNTFPIDNSDKTLLVRNSDDLFFAVSNGYKPQFYNEEDKPYYFYQRAREICRNFISDDMTDLEKYQTLFDYIVYYGNYDYDALTDSSGGYFIYNTCYFLEGLMEYNYAVCDGLSKLYAVLCGIEGLEVKRGFGYSSDGGHAWDYIKYNGKWYLTCPTWGQNDVKAENFTQYGQNCTFVDYSAFGTKSDFFYEVSGHNAGSNFVQKVYPETLNSAQNHIDISSELAAGSPSTVDYYISSKAEFTELLNICRENCGNTNFTITIRKDPSVSISTPSGSPYTIYTLQSSYGNEYMTCLVVF